MMAAIFASISVDWLHRPAGVDSRYPFIGLPDRSRFRWPLSSNSTSRRPSSFRFLNTEEDLEKLRRLENYSYHKEMESGFLWVRTMREEETEMTASLLAECFAESMVMAASYVKLLKFLVTNYLMERRETLPNSATLIGSYRENGEEDFELAGTVELTFSSGANHSPPTPTPPKDSPYICNMAVRKPIRRRGIGWHLLRAGEELITEMNPATEAAYLHCRMIDEGPLNMYRKAGYTIVKTDSLLTLLTLQRRRHLMRKRLPPPPPYLL